MAMQMLYVHLRAAGPALVLFALLAFGLPLFVVQGSGSSMYADGALISLGLRLRLLEASLPLFPALAVAVGATLALSAWSWDHKGNHVYALSLPVSRARYALLKFGAGAALALVPAASLLLGGVVAAAAVDLPAGLRAYPVQLAGHFLFAVLVLYALFFALASGTTRTAVAVLSLVIGVPLVASVGVELLGGVYPFLQSVDVGGAVETVLFDFGPLRILTGNWMLIDV